MIFTKEKLRLIVASNIFDVKIAAVLVLSLIIISCGENKDLNSTSPSLNLTITPFITPTYTRYLNTTAIKTYNTTPLYTQLHITPVQSASTSIFMGKNLEEILETNGDCRLPCVWGILPGISTWENIMSLFQLFQPEIKVSTPSVIKRESNSYRVSTNYLLFKPLGNNPEAGLRITLIDGITSIIFVDKRSSGNLFMLRNILNDYGMPDNVLINAKRFPGDEYPFHLVLFFSRIHFLVHYEMTAPLQDGILKACPSSINPSIYSWSSYENSYVDYGRIDEWTLGGYGLTPYQFKSIDKTNSNMDIDSFYQTFTEPSNNVCLESPEGNWP